MKTTTAVTLSNQNTGGVSRTYTIDVLISRFLSAQDVKHSSIGTYTRQLKQFSAWLTSKGQDTALHTLTRHDILEYKNQLTKSGKSPQTVSGYITAVRKLFEWLESEKIYPNIARSIKSPKKERGFKKDCLTEAQISEALEHINTDTADGKRDYAIINLMLRTGIRTVEIARARVSDINQQSGEAVLWVHGKGHNSADEFVLLTPAALKPIQSWVSTRGTYRDDAPLFCSLSDRNQGGRLTPRSISRIVKTVLRGIGIDDRRLSAHSLRHTAITLSIKGGATLQQAQAMARHTDPRTTMIYFHNINRVKDGAEKYIHF